MHKININGKVYVRQEDVCEVLRWVDNHPLNDVPDPVATAISSVKHLLFYDELEEAKTQEERDLILEMPGTFIVFKKIKGEKKVVFVKEWVNGKAVITMKGEEAMRFNYGVMASDVAEKIGDEWKTICISYEYNLIRERGYQNLMKALDELDEEDAETEDDYDEK